MREGESRLALAVASSRASIRSPLLSSRPSRCSRVRNQSCFTRCVCLGPYSALNSAASLSLRSPRLPRPVSASVGPTCWRCRALKRRGQQAMQAAGTQITVSTAFSLTGAGARTADRRLCLREQRLASTLNSRNGSKRPPTRSKASPSAKHPYTVAKRSSLRACRYVFPHLRENDEAHLAELPHQPRRVFLLGSSSRLRLPMHRRRKHVSLSTHFVG